MRELSIVVGVSTVLGLAALAMWLYYQLERARLSNRAEASIAQGLEGEAKLKAKDILKVILSFKDEARRIEAVRLFTGYDERRAKIFVDATSANPDVIKLKTEQGDSQQRMKLAGSMFVLFLIVGAVAKVAETYMERPSITAPVPAPIPDDRPGVGPTPAPSTPAASTAASAAPPPPPERQTLTYPSGTKDSGPGKQFSGQYEVCSQGIPAGFRIESSSFRLVGDRSCNAYSTCARTLDLPQRVCYSFSLQGHEEIARNDGIKQSEGILTVVIVKP